MSGILYIFTFIVLLLSLQIYFPFARRRNMLAGVNHRSSHTKPVITGAGFIFFLSYMIYAGYLLFASEQPFPWCFFAGMTMLSIISFVDDLEEVWFLWRLLVQIAATFLMMLQVLMETQTMNVIPSVTLWIAIFMAWGFSIGLLNMYNFMDGLNGMLGSLVLSSLLPMWLINNYVRTYAVNDFFYFTLIPTLIFMFYNARKQAKCFSGDVGAIAVGFTMTYLLIKLMVETSNFVYLAMYTMIFVEAGLTIVQRLFAGDNIFQPHRIHLFQLLCNEGKRNHVLVSAVYGGIQLLIGLLLFAMNYYQVPYWCQHVIVWPIVALLAVWYLLYKRKKMGGHLLGYRK